MRLSFSTPLVLLITFLSAAAPAKPVRYDMRDGGLRNLVEFVSDAMLEKVVGISNAVSGWIELDPERLGDGIRGEFEVDVRTFETGIELRNEHIREKILGGGEFPLANFSLGKLTSVSKAKLGVGAQPVVARVEGQLKAKGQTRAQAVLLKLIYIPESELTKTRLPGNLLKVSANFEVDTNDFGITVPEAFKARFSRYIQVTVDAVGTDRPPTSPEVPVRQALVGEKAKK